MNTPADLPEHTKTEQAWWTRHGLWLVFTMLLFPNMVGSAVNIWYNLIHIKPLLNQEQELSFARIILVYNILVYPVATGMWLSFMVSLWGPFHQLLADQVVPAARIASARRLVINLPWWGSGIAAMCWLTCIPVFLLGLDVLAGPLDDRLYWHLPISFLISGTMAITHGFFIIEIMRQRLLYPVFFRDARPAETPGAIPVTLRARGFLWAVSAGVCPIASLLLMHLAPHEHGQEVAWFALAVAAIGMIFGLTTAWLLCFLVVDPIAALRQAALAVGRGNLNVRIPLLHADEFGTLIDEFNHMVAELREKLRLQQTFGLHVGHQAAKNIMERDPGLGGVDEEITVVFVDIRNFTARSSCCTPQQIVGLLNVFLTEMVEIVEEQHGGMVNKFLGDGFMALFGAGGGPSDHADAAASAGRDMRIRLAELNHRITAQGHDPLQIGVGIHTGRAVVGSIGSPRRMEYTAIGDTVNVASRVESLTKVVGESLLLTATTRAAMRSQITTEELPPQSVKGQTEPIIVCRVPR